MVVVNQNVVIRNTPCYTSGMKPSDDTKATRPDPISMRLPEELKVSLAKAAEAAGRSLNAEIRMRLEFSFDHGFDGAPSDKMLANEIESLRKELRGSLYLYAQRMDALEAAIKAKG